MTMNDTPQTIAGGHHKPGAVTAFATATYEYARAVVRADAAAAEKEAAYEALADAEDALKHARAVLLDEATARVRAES